MSMNSVYDYELDGVSQPPRKRYKKGEDRNSPLRLKDKLAYVYSKDKIRNVVLCVFAQCVIFKK